MGCIPSKRTVDATGTRDVGSGEQERKYSISFKYPFPEKDYGGDRLVLQHYLFRYIWQSNFSSPIEELLETPGKKVLDFGCGSGAWILDMSKEYPKASFIGIEQANNNNNNNSALLSGDGDNKPENVSFQICDDLTRRLPFEDNSFDYIHVRFMATVIPEKELEEKILPDLIRILKPGCYIEIMDVNCEGNNEGPSTQILMSSIQSYYKSKGFNPLITSKLKSLLDSTGSLTDINSDESHHPLGSWEDKIGEIALNNWLQTLNQLKTDLVPYMNIGEDEYREYIRSFKDEVDMFQTYWTSKRVYGKKNY